MEDDRQTRRTFVKRVAYAAPLILSLSVAPSFARNGSGGNQEGGGGPQGASNRGNGSKE